MGDFQDIASVVEEFGTEPSGTVPPGIYPIYDWGCGIYTLLDFTDSDGAVWGIAQGAVFPEGINLAAWLGRAVDGTLERPDERHHPNTARLPRW